MATVLLLEDSHELLRLYMRYLTRDGHNVEPFMTAEAALDVFDQVKFDLVISDLRLGNFSIERLIQRLKRVHEAGTPVLVISAHLDSYQDLCIDSGLIHYLAKPIEKQQLLNKAKQMLKNVDVFREANHYYTTNNPHVLKD
jgi:DNA-binding response OmpR family regulator